MTKRNRSRIEALRTARVTAVVALAILAGACALGSLGGFGGGLDLNVTSVQSRGVTIEISSGDPEARIVRLDAGQEVELGRGSVTFDRYVIQNVTFGDDVATGLFLCEAPCENPVEAFVVAYSPDQLFESTGELQLRFRVVHEEAEPQELSHNIGPQLLPSLWRDPSVAIAAESP